MIWPSAIEDAAGRLLRLDDRMLWRVRSSVEERTAYLTFDDAPCPG